MIGSLFNQVSLIVIAGLDQNEKNDGVNEEDVNGMLLKIDEEEE